jgi:pilus assembly protein TadC
VDPAARGQGAALSVVVASLAAALAAASLPPSPRPAASRLPGRRQGRPRAALPVVGAAALAVLLLAGGPLAVGLAVALGFGLIARRFAGGRAADPDAQLPLAVEVLAGCLAAGAGLAAAIRTAAIVAPQVSADWDRVAAALERGSPAATAWGAWASTSARREVVRVTARGAGTGAAVGAELLRVAARARAARRTDGEARVQRAAVWVVLPLGLCFLPAFVLVGVVPLVLGLVRPLA